MAYKNIKSSLSSSSRNIGRQNRYYTSSGFTQYDMLTHGFANGQLTVIASRPAMGKSSFIETLILELGIKQERNIAYFSLETDERMLMNRLISNLSGVPIEKFIHSNDKEILKQIDESILLLENVNLTVDYQSDIDIDEIMRKSKELVYLKKVEIIFIDFLQLITAKNLKAPNREQEIGYIIRNLKVLAKELYIPIIITSQLNRSTLPSKKPNLGDLRDSGTIEDVCDVVTFIHRPEYYGLTMDENGLSTEGLAEIIIAKNRHGKCDTFRINYEKNIFRFMDYDDFGD